MIQLFSYATAFKGTGSEGWDGPHYVQSDSTKITTMLELDSVADSDNRVILDEEYTSIWISLESFEYQKVNGTDYYFYSMISPEENNTKVTLDYSLSNYPNPFNPETTINFSIPKESKVTLTIYNIKGQQVATLVNEVMNSGNNQILWRGLDGKGNKVTSGVYFYKLTTFEKTLTNKMLLLK
ncbi:MAG: T9SS type A sorting domain-containing protein [Candidatus Cloacimonetes bacterium]|nr:T9SS type A sorting domain-containing protein [Candidatus Cloacimonadota bacterium]